MGSTQPGLAVRECFEDDRLSFSGLRAVAGRTLTEGLEEEAPAAVNDEVWPPCPVQHFDAQWLVDEADCHLLPICGRAMHQRLPWHMYLVAAVHRMKRLLRRECLIRGKAPLNGTAQLHFWGFPRPVHVLIPCLWLRNSRIATLQRLERQRWVLDGIHADSATTQHR